MHKLKKYWEKVSADPVKIEEMEEIVCEALEEIRRRFPISLATEPQPLGNFMFGCSFLFSVVAFFATVGDKLCINSLKRLYEVIIHKLNILS